MRRFGLYSETEIKQICSVIRNFLNYILHHAVCPEYTKDLLAARKICDLAEKELWAIKQVQYLLPGDFNVAASTLYGGFYKGIRFDNTWEKNSEQTLSIDQGLRDGDAELVFNAVIAMSGSDDLYLKVKKGNVAIVRTETKCKSSSANLNFKQPLTCFQLHWIKC
jgi:hypothetical protein